jgi:hypothetical protein
MCYSTAVTVVVLEDALFGFGAGGIFNRPFLAFQVDSLAINPIALKKPLFGWVLCATLVLFTETPP